MAKQTVNLGVVPNGVGGDDVRTGFTKVNDNFTELYTLPTQAEAEAGTSQVVRGWTAQRIRQAIIAWYTGISGTIGRTILGRSTAEQVRGDLGLGSAATKDVGTAAGNVMEATSGGTSFPGFNVPKTIGWYFAAQIQDFAGAPEGATGGYLVRVDRSNMYTLYQNTTSPSGKIYFGVSPDGVTPPTTWREVFHTENLPVYAQRWPSFTEVTGKPTTFTPSTHTHPVSQVTGLGTAATANLTTSNTDGTADRVLKVGDGGWMATQAASPLGGGMNNSSLPTSLRLTVSNTEGALGAGTFLQLQRIDGEAFQLHFYGDNVASRKVLGSTYPEFSVFYTTSNTTKNPDGTLKASSPVINLYTDKHDLHNGGQFGATPSVVRKSKGVYEITGTLGLRSEGWYLDTPSDRNGNKYFNVEWTQNITPEAVDGVVDEYRDDIVVTIETFERVWNKDTGLFENGAPMDINDLQDRFVQLRFNEIKVEHEEVIDDLP